MANNITTNQKVLPNPFQNVASALGLAAGTKTTSDSVGLHGYRSNFNINQQKEVYQQRINQQRPNFNRNTTQHNRPERNGTQNGNAYTSQSNNVCELCDCSFKQPYQLEKHLREHEKCWFDNCYFEGHSKLLQQHIEMQHQSGLFQRIGKIETEEDIEKWREERRKRYPTKANIAARQLAQEERLKRGERIQEPNNRFGQMQNRKKAQQHRQPNQNDTPKRQSDKKKQDKRRKRTRRNDKKGMADKDSSAKDEVSKTESNEAANDQLKADQGSVETKEEAAPSSNALSALLGMYGSDSESDNQETSDEDIANGVTVPLITSAADLNKTSPPQSIDRKRTASCDIELPNKQMKVEIDERNEMQAVESDSDDEAPEEQPINRQSHDSQQPDETNSGPTQIQPEEETKAVPQALHMAKKRTVLDMTRKIRNQNTLLEKLLQKDIRHERNVLLQCVRYVVANNFFGIGAKGNSREKVQMDETEQ